MASPALDRDLEGGAHTYRGSWVEVRQGRMTSPALDRDLEGVGPWGHRGWTQPISTVPKALGVTHEACDTL